MYKHEEAWYMYKKVKACHEHLTEQWNETYGRMKGVRKPNWMEAVGNIARSFFFFSLSKNTLGKNYFFFSWFCMGLEKWIFLPTKVVIFFFSS